MYARSDREFAVTVPPREYELAARLLVQAVEADPSDRSRTALAGAARRLGTELGSACRPAAGEGDAAGRDVKGVLTQQGYEPCCGADGVIRLRNCPFHQIAEQHRELVCGMNLALVEGLVEGLGADGWHPALDPQPGQCCVAIGGDRS
jgi:predicted ArsR family transcriptional regulator